jgi:hypothetical protein
VTGPLAQQFAQVRGITARIIEAINAGDFIEAEKLSLQFDAALSVIERHVQDIAEAVEESRERAERLQSRQNASVENLLRPRQGQPIQNAARALVGASDDAERNAALGDLYNALVLHLPEIPEGDER